MEDWTGPQTDRSTLMLVRACKSESRETADPCQEAVHVTGRLMAPPTYTAKARHVHEVVAWHRTRRNNLANSVPSVYVRPLTSNPA